jgi:hypothetical protein
MCYSLRRWAGLTARGNPTILHSLFTDSTASRPEWSEIIAQRELFLARNHAKKYHGYAEAQMKRMSGLRGRGKHGQRPEIIEKFGFDTKAAMHTLRLLIEGIELMKEHRVTLPRTNKERELLLEVRRGEWSEERVIRHATRLFSELEQTAARSSLPESVDLKRISDLVGKLYVQNWTTRG